MEFDNKDSGHINVCVGRNIEKRRKVLRMSQADLGKLVSVSSQQIHKYETGETRIPLDKIYLLSVTLNISLAELFSGIIKHEIGSNQYNDNMTSLLNEDETLKLIRNYISIDDPKARDSISQVTKQVAKICSIRLKKSHI